MNTLHTQPSVRKSLIENTRAAHQELHKHHWIAALARPTITSGNYHRVLIAYRAFYKHVESARAELSTYPQLSLETAISALDDDVSDQPSVEQRSEHRITLSLADSPSVLGALYVLHGAGFGASILNRNIKKALPTMKRSFLSAGTTQATWQQLNGELECMTNQPKAAEKLEATALETFISFGTFVTLVCESHTCVSGPEDLLIT